MELFSHWNEVRRDLLRAIDSLSDEDLRFVPREGLWSLGQVACHIAGAERGWLSLVLGEPDARFDYAADDYPSAAAISSLLSSVHRRTIETLEEIETSDFGREVLTPWGTRHNVGWVIWHVLEHEIHHRGEIYLMIGLLGREAPDV